MCRYSIEMLGRKNFFSISTSSFLLHLYLNSPLSLHPSLHFSLPFNFSLSLSLSLSLPLTLSFSLCYPFTHSLSLPPFLSLSRSFSLSPSLYLPMPFVSPPLTSPHLTSKDVNDRAKAESLLSSTAAAQAAGQIRRLSGMKRKLPTIYISYSILSTLRF